MDWKCFMFQSKSGRYDQYHSNRIYYRHWLSPCINNTNLDLYEEFDTISHVTSYENAPKIFKHGFQERPVQDNSVVNHKVLLYTEDLQEPGQRPCHPLSNSKVMWYGPGKISNFIDENYTAERYGNVMFLMKNLNGFEGIYREGLRYYFIEVIEYVTQSACRILVTRNYYPELMEYNPYQLGGPWYRDSAGKNYYLKRMMKYGENNFVPNVLEIMKEPDGHFRDLWVNNHYVTFCKCINPRKGVISVDWNPDTNETRSLFVLRLAFGIIGSKEYRMFPRFKLINKMVDPQMDDEELKRMIQEFHGYASREVDLSEIASGDAANTTPCESILTIFEDQSPNKTLENIVKHLLNLNRNHNIDFNFSDEMRGDGCAYIRRLIKASYRQFLDLEKPLKTTYREMLVLVPEQRWKELPGIIADLLFY